MRLTDDLALARLAGADHGVLSTLHATRGVDSVPVAFAAADDGWLGVPIDRVKPKAGPRLQRERNLERDGRATLLVEHWDPGDWSQLWWVRAELRWQPDPPLARVDDLADLLADRYAQYREQPFHRVLVLRIVGLVGWNASGPPS